MHTISVSYMGCTFMRNLSTRPILLSIGMLRMFVGRTMNCSLPHIMFWPWMEKCYLLMGNCWQVMCCWTLTTRLIKSLCVHVPVLDQQGVITSCYNLNLPTSHLEAA